MSNSKFRRWIVDGNSGPVEIDVVKYGITEGQRMVKLEGRKPAHVFIYKSYKKAAHVFHEEQFWAYRGSFLALKDWISELAGCDVGFTEAISAMRNTLTIGRIDRITTAFSEMSDSISQTLHLLRKSKEMIEWADKYDSSEEKIENE